MNDRLLKRLILKEIHSVLKESDEETVKKVCSILQEASNKINEALDLPGLKSNMKMMSEVMELQGRIENFIEDNSGEPFNDDDEEANDPYDGMYDPDDQ